MTDAIGTEDGRLRVEAITHEQAAWIILRGEADLATLPELETTLGSVELDGAKSVHLHVADLTFCDVATLRELTIFAKHLRETGYQVATYGARPVLQKIARLLNVDSDLGIS